MFKEIKFLIAVWKANLESNMEFRISFLSQAVGMIINDSIYFLVWVIFFDRFRDVRGWGVTDMYVTFGLTASAYGLVALLFGNVFSLGDIITKGRLDYYLSLPRPVLLHAVASRSIASGLGDFTYGFLSYLASGVATWDGLLRFIVGIILASVVLTSFMMIVQSLSFWMGTTSYLAGIANNAMLTFAIYPITLFEPGPRLLLFTLIPAALMGAVPVTFVRGFNWGTLAELMLGGAVLLGIAVLLFHGGLRRYESGSAVQVEV